MEGVGGESNPTPPTFPTPPTSPTSPTLFSLTPHPSTPVCSTEGTSARNWLPLAPSIETWLAKWIADELKIAVDSIDTRKSFVYYGLDSVTAIEFTSDLEVWLGRELSPTLAWDYPSIEILAQHLAEEIDVSVPAGRPWAGREDGHKDSQVNVIDLINQEKAEQPLVNLDLLSDEEVDSLLSQMLAAEEVNS